MLKTIDTERPTMSPPYLTQVELAVRWRISPRNLARDALYRAGGADPGIAVRVIVRRPDRIGEFGDTRIASETATFDVRTSEIAEPAEGGTLDVDGVTYVIQGEPLRDAERLIWSIEARPL